MKIQKIRADYAGYELADVNEATAVEMLEFLFNQKNWRTHPDGLEIIDRKIRQCQTRLWAEPVTTVTSVWVGAISTGDSVVTTAVAPLDYERPRWEKVQALRKADASWTLSALATKFGVSVTTIANDLKRRAKATV